MADGRAEFLSTKMPDRAPEAVTEIKELVREFTGHFDWFTEAFSAGEIDWAAHNDMAQLLHPIRSKAGRISDEQLSDVVWKIEQMFSDIHFDDIEANAPHVRQLAELVDQLLVVMKRIAG
jgi:chemotaxis protein histidine kinase CheA